MNIKRIIQEYDAILEARTGIPFIMSTFAAIESDFTPDAKRIEPGFYRRYMKGNSYYDQLVKEYGNDAYSSLGIFQIMYTTAIMYDKALTPEDLKNPYVNSFIAYRIIKSNIDKFGIDNSSEWVQQYNGGSARSKRTERYFKKWLSAWDKKYKKARGSLDNGQRDKVKK